MDPVASKHNINNIKFRTFMLTNTGSLMSTSSLHLAST